MIKQLRIDAVEAQLIESCLRECDKRWFLFQLGYVMVSGQEKEIGVSEDDLWYLREKINPSAKVGKITGVDVLKKIYGLLIEAAQEKGAREAGLSGMPLINKGVSNAFLEIRYTDRSTTQNHAKG